MADFTSASPLGKQTDYVATYSPGLLFSIAREISRKLLSFRESLPFYGADVWTGYEISWLDQRGKPQVAIAEFYIPCNSEFIIESKSFKLYLNSLNQTCFTNAKEVREVLVRDLSAGAGAVVEVRLQTLSGFGDFGIKPMSGELIDELSVAIEHYHP